jgi:hypothetical protein
MPPEYLHNQRDFPALMRILEEEMGIQAGLIEKDYWIMHVLYGLKKQGFAFELKGGTSLSKGYRIIDRFSEDIDIHIKPPAELRINENPKNNNPGNIAARKTFYDRLATEIKIDGIVAVERDNAFDDTIQYRSGGIRLLYESQAVKVTGVKEGILLEAGFDTVTPNHELLISSWAFDRAHGNPDISLIDNRAIKIACYHPGFTFVEKLQTIATRFRQEQEDKVARPNLMRQYYDVFCLLGDEKVQVFIGTEEYARHKEARFPTKDKVVPIAQNQAFLLHDPELRNTFRRRYLDTASLYYNGQPDFDELLARLEAFIHLL